MKARVARIAVLAVVTFFVIIAVTAINLDYGRFKGQVETIVSDALQRPFVIGGPMHLTVGRTIRLSAAGMQLAGLKPAVDPPLVSVGRVEAVIDTWSLIRGPIRIESLNVNEVRVNLEAFDDGGNNWTFPGTAEVPSDIAAETTRPTLPLLPDNIEISDLLVRYGSPAFAEPVRLLMDRLRVDIAEGQQQVRAELAGSLNETAVALNIAAGDIDTLMDFRQVDIEIDGRVGEIRFDGDARVEDLLVPRRPTASLNLSGPNIEYLTDILGLRRITTGPLQLESSIAPSGDKMQLSLSGQFGEFAASATGQFDDLRKLENVSVDIEAGGPDAGRVAMLAGLNGVPSQPFEVVGRGTRSGKRLSVEEVTVNVGETRLELTASMEQFPGLADARAALRVEGPDIAHFGQLLGLKGRLQGPFSIVADITPRDAGGAGFLMTANVSDITGQADGELTSVADLAGSRARLTFQGSDLRTVTNAFGLENAPNIAFSGSATVERIAAGVRIEDGVVNIGDDRLSMSGTVGNRPLSSETAIDFDARVANLPGTLGDFAIDAARLPATRFRLAGALSAEATTSAGARLILTDGTASYAGLEATMAGNFAVPGILEDSRLRFRASGDDLQAVLPANDLFRALDKPFNAEGTLTISSGNVSIPDFRFGIDQSRLTADLRAALDPAMTALRAKVDVVSPNLYALSPYFADKSLPGTVAPFELHSDLSLEDGLLTVDVLRATIGAGLLDISGTATGPPAFDGTDLRIDLQLADMRRLNVLLGQELPELPASLTLHLIGNANVARLEEFAASIGDSDFAGEFEIRSGEIPEISFLLSSERLDVTPFLPPAETASPVPAAGSKPVARSADRVIPDTDIPFERLQGVKATANLKVAEIVAGPKRIRDFAIEAVLADGALGVNRFALRTGQDGELSGRLHIDPLADGARVGMRLRGTNLRFGLPALTAEELAQVPRYDLSVAFLTSGRNLRELASVLNGYLKMTVGPGRIRATAMRIFTNDFLSQLLNTVNPFVKNDPYTNLKCSAILLAIENGQLVGDPALVAQSDRINIHSKVKIDLRTEKLEADINTVPTKGLGLSLSNLVNPYVMVGGTLAAPVIGLDPESTLIEGGAAVATGGLSILAKGLKDRFFSDRDPCGTAVANADEKFAELERKYAKHPAIDQ